MNNITPEQKSLLIRYAANVAQATLALVDIGNTTMLTLVRRSLATELRVLDEFIDSLED